MAGGWVAGKQIGQFVPSMGGCVGGCELQNEKIVPSMGAWVGGFYFQNKYFTIYGWGGPGGGGGGGQPSVTS